MISTSTLPESHEFKLGDTFSRPEVNSAYVIAGVELHSGILHYKIKNTTTGVAFYKVIEDILDTSGLYLLSDKPSIGHAINLKGK